MVFRATDGVVGVLGVVHGDGGDAAPVGHVTEAVLSRAEKVAHFGESKTQLHKR